MPYKDENLCVATCYNHNKSLPESILVIIVVIITVGLHNMDVINFLNNSLRCKYEKSIAIIDVVLS